MLYQKSRSRFWGFEKHDRGNLVRIGGTSSNRHSTFMSNDLYQQIQQFYDASSSLWENIWGEHMHHGYYGADGKKKLEKRQAQIDLIEELLKWSAYNSPATPKIIDIGCGIGGSSLYLAEKLHGEVVGITLSPVQANRAQERATAMDLSDKATFKVANALDIPYPDNSFDLVWTLESGEHMPDKDQFLQECYRVLKPGGRMILATWCHRSTEGQAGALTPSETKHLQKIYDVYCLPYVISLPDYEEIVTKCGFEGMRSADWSVAVAPFWDVVIDSSITPQAILGLFKAGWKTIQAALSLRLMSQGYERGLIKFGLITATK
jgi:tocopherol O-methyltransferase